MLHPSLLQGSPLVGLSAVLCAEHLYVIRIGLFQRRPIARTQHPGIGDQHRFDIPELGTPFRYDGQPCLAFVQITGKQFLGDT